MSDPSRKVLWIVWGFVGLTMAGVLSVFILQKGRAPSDPILFEIADFALTNQNGQLVKRADLRGHVWLADIIFTRCGGPCPEMTRRMAEVQAAVPVKAPVKFVTLTTDPEFDTPRVLLGFSQRFGADASRWEFLTGTKQQIYDVAVRGLKLTAVDQEKEKQQNPNDLFVHSTIFVLMDRQGRARAVFEPLAGDEAAQKTSKARLLGAINRLLRER